MNKRYAIILAAGQGSRMKSKKYKVLHEIAGKSMVDHVLTQVETLAPEEVVTIVGFGAEMVKETLGERTKYALQSEQLGTGHAVIQAKEILADKEGTTLVICGDTPLLRAETLQELFETHEKSGAKATVLTAHADNPFAYGRIIRDEQGAVLKIVEEKDASEEERLVQEINTGTFCFDNKALFDSLEKVGNDNEQQEYYLPDVIGILQAQDEIVAAYQMSEFAESIGVNDRKALAVATAAMRRRINEQHMVNGVTFVNPEATYIDVDVEIGNDTLIEAGVSLKGHTTIGSQCVIGANSEIIDSVLHDDVVVQSSTIKNAVIYSGADVGPYAHVRPNSKIGENVHIGNFVEVKNAKIDQGTKVGHLTYVGDADLGKNINIGCGTVFVNYDGKNKFRSVIEDDVFIGCNANLIAPVKVGKNAYIAAGSTITEDVPSKNMAIARAHQVNKPGYADKLPFSK
ncbi:bifunctional UDP-N-acetylglucosamine diphosphorylase/glucosamine-1-phosphate N-acetyltransferase GlmU [Vagococcus xieshaowenii]|uniref:Bifunctional protein GlmU n=1 Tax=Vagococcus xieshaowenii TaxID=2562451 RepID=A0AAJ5JKZ1_9ENTE|nr:bifunctional UDP-N-acetylglucosamine diphosphorylase/glucosamine-1-phosphate N-acetyltransferase GlmU [Vagococcus xieshaowenii]QCA28069.1 bifunctional UDP-N-acetylglucosamine diphosphorylase/glucosamine-1-phosphate N-acetyltransferase GlmU [Vagococcus xieshaowenii]TFZ40112.1 bifunctional UDP-N-acetylglucosamine diphosphorylase/glucosamine-1-phosphate N-acetyltransferase GlmU [Vagococcus xieshaowenii]